MPVATVNRPIMLDGDIADWPGVSGIAVPLSGEGESTGDVGSVELKAAGISGGSHNMSGLLDLRTVQPDS